jgi:hypothetical protein
VTDVRKEPALADRPHRNNYIDAPESGSVRCSDIRGNDAYAAPHPAGSRCRSTAAEATRGGIRPLALAATRKLPCTCSASV